MLKVLLIIFVVWVLTFVLKVIISMWEERSHIHTMLYSFVLFLFVLSFFIFYVTYKLIYNSMLDFLKTIMKDSNLHFMMLNFGKSWKVSKVYNHEFIKRFFQSSLLYKRIDENGINIPLSLKQKHPHLIFLLKDRKTSDNVFIEVNLTSKPWTTLQDLGIVKNPLVGSNKEKDDKSYLCIKDAEYTVVTNDTKQGILERFKLFKDGYLKEKTDFIDNINMSEIVPIIINEGKIRPEEFDLIYNDQQVSLDEFKKLIEFSDKLDKKD